MFDCWGVYSPIPRSLGEFHQLKTPSISSCEIALLALRPAVLVLNIVPFCGIIETAKWWCLWFDEKNCRPTSGTIFWPLEQRILSWKYRRTNQNIIFAIATKTPKSYGLS
jgi:hypothetical protein